MTDRPTRRPRRLRVSPAMRNLTRETRIHPSQLVLPLFVHEGLETAREIPSMPRVFQYPVGEVADQVERASAAGLGGVMLFGVPLTRDPRGSQAVAPDGVLNRALKKAVAAAGDQIVVMSDLCLDEFTDHGHCGVLATDGSVDNDATLEIYAEVAVAQARTGAHVLGLSGMMDRQVAAVRSALDTAGFTDTSVLAYAAKYASAAYGPFRDAVDSQLQGDRRTYQMDPANVREGLFEAELDEAEGADIVMVKPALPYLDVLADVAAHARVPVAAYHVSGEYSQIEAAAERGWIDRQAAHMEAVTSIVRAGADIVLTYAALEIAQWVRQR